MTKREAAAVHQYLVFRRDRYLNIVAVIAQDITDAFSSQSLGRDFIRFLTDKYEYCINKTAAAVQKVNYFAPEREEDLEILAADL